MCRDPKRCQETTEKRYQRMEPLLDWAERFLSNFAKEFFDNKGKIRVLRHGQKREFQRAFSKHQIIEAILNGEPIEVFQTSNEHHVLIWHFLKTGARSYRPVHVKVKVSTACTGRMNSMNVVEIITIYDPRTKPWKWSQNYGRRICVCEEE